MTVMQQGGGITFGECTCSCPDGPGIHMCGCHTYDTRYMANLRGDWEEAQADLNTHFKLFENGEIPPYRHKNFAGQISALITRLCRIAADMAIEDRRNNSGNHTNEPWN